ncbi:hypothetical protein I552_3089 [Mycobacterium xenopi 3993]|nr:hypothetical protein I552_3089 [Mycobacterium xenopi 3993]
METRTQQTNAKIAKNFPARPGDQFATSEKQTGAQPSGWAPVVAVSWRRGRLR